jgi:hypothetical protein
MSGKENELVSCGWCIAFATGGERISHYPDCFLNQPENKERKRAFRNMEKGISCDNCGSVAGTNNGKLLKCAGCLTVHYCGAECQKKKWKDHKKICKK